MSFSKNTANAYKAEVTPTRPYDFLTVGWVCQIKQDPLNWVLEGKFEGTKKQRMTHRQAFADLVKAFVPEGSSFRIHPIPGGQRITWTREDLVDRIVEEALS